MERQFTLNKRGDVFFVSLKDYVNQQDPQQQQNVTSKALSAVISTYQSLDATSSDWVNGVDEMLDCLTAILKENEFPLNPSFSKGDELRRNLLDIIFAYLGKEAAQVYVTVASSIDFDVLLSLVEIGADSITISIDFPGEQEIKMPEGNPQN